MKKETRGGVRKYFPCVYKGKVYASLNAAAQDSPWSNAQFSRMYRDGIHGDDLKIISIVEYEHQTGEKHPSKFLYKTGNTRFKHTTEDLEINRMISAGWPAVVQPDWRGAEGEV